MTASHSIFTIHVIVNHPVSEDEFTLAPLYTQTAVAEQVKDIIEDNPTATSFVFTIVRQQ